MNLVLKYNHYIVIKFQNTLSCFQLFLLNILLLCAAVSNLLVSV